MSKSGGNVNSGREKIRIYSRPMSKLGFVIFTLIILLSISGTYAQESKATMEASPIRETIYFDGELSEPAWKSAEKVTQFTQRELYLGMDATEQTEVAVLYDEKFIYIGVWCYDSEPDKIVAKEMRRDFSYGLDDNFIVIIDTYLDQRNGFMFVTNPNGARADLQVFNNGSSVNNYWNGVWDVRTTRNDQGWFAEIKIPFYTLKYRSGIEDQVWGINFERNIRRKREQSRWQGWNRNYNITNVNRAGLLTNLNEIRDERFVEVKPYGLGGLEYDDENGSSEVLNAGGDINALLSPTYRLNVTFNTDFAQVESDQQQINLERFPLFFPELREFFLEGDDFFDFGFGGNRIIPFYSRRIGLNEDRETVPIIAGARLLGKERNTTLGAMSIQTASQDGEPTANYTTLSWRQDVGGQSVIGAMTTNKITDGRWHTTTGVNGRYSTSNLFGNRNLDLGGAVIQTYNTDEGYQDRAFAYRFFASYPNDKMRIFASTQRSPAAFEPEVGLMRRRNFRESFFQLSLNPRPKKNLMWIRQFDFSPGSITYVQYDDNQELQSFQYSMRFLGLNTRTGETINFNYEVVAEGLREDFNIFDDVIIEKGTYWWNRWRANFSTFSGRQFSLNTSFTTGEFFNGTSFQNNSNILWRASKYITLDLRYEKNIIDLPNGSFETDLIGSRIQYAINPQAFGSLLTQWNSAQEEVNVNFRLQIIPKIGTDFYLIYNQIVDTRNNELVFERSTLLAKLIWRFVI